MRCEEAEGLLSDHLNGDLAPPEAAALESHLASCPACRGALAELRWVTGLLQDVPPMAPPADLGARIHNALAALDGEAVPAQPTAPKIPCDEAHDYFSGHLEADLDDWEARALAGHLEACGECRLALKQLEAVKALLRAVPPETLPSGFEARIHAAIEALDGGAMGCEDVQERLSDRLEGALPAAELTSVEAHLEGCADCRLQARQLEAVKALLRAVPREALPAGFEARVHDALEAIPGDAAQTSPLVAAPVSMRRRLSWPSAAVGAVAAAAMVFFWHMQPGNLPRIETAAVSANTNVAVNIGFDVASRVEGVTYQIDLPEGLQFVDDHGKPMLAQSVAWKGSLEQGKTVVPIVVRGMRPGNYEIQAYVSKGAMRQKTTIVLPVTG